ncbi:MAG: phosphoribosylaminoimidazole-succinocarboxamide synthase [Myxococcota bacterium]|jgi:phosphoribosylaminoimidazole-succinocarboxamide synthase
MLSPEVITAALPHVVLTTDLGIGDRIEGKVRDIYLQGDRRMLVVSDRLSAFDRIITAVPFKGQVLNQLAAWWFEQTADVLDNHIISMPDPQVTLAREANALPVEVVVRGYITGVTSTALWTLYSDGVQRPYGLDLPTGLVKNQRLATPVITPTTKGGPGEHDERLSSAEVVERGLVEPTLWAQIEQAALALFARGTELAAENGMILVDTKYEFGLVDGKLIVIDEVHTPDSSRYWYADTYDAAMAAGEEPRALDKEYMRRWLKDMGYTGDGAPPPVPESVIVECASRYIEAYERITGQTFVAGEQPALDRIRRAVSAQ